MGATEATAGGRVRWTATYLAASAGIAIAAALDGPVRRATGYEGGRRADLRTIARTALWTILFGTAAAAMADLALWLWPDLPERPVKAVKIGLSTAMGVMLYQTLSARRARTAE